MGWNFFQIFAIISSVARTTEALPKHKGLRPHGPIQFITLISLTLSKVLLTYPCPSLAVVRTSSFILQKNNGSVDTQKRWSLCSLLRTPYGLPLFAADVIRVISFDA